MLFVSVSGGMMSCASHRTLDKRQRIKDAEHRTLNTEYRAQNAERDTVHVLDSVIIQARNDTVYIDRWRTEWRERQVEKMDTVIHTEVQTVEIEKILTQDKVPRWCWWLLIINIIVVLFFMLRRFILH